MHVAVAIEDSGGSRVDTHRHIVSRRSVGAVATLLAVDAATLYFRAFFGVPGTFRSPDGAPVNALRGYLDMTATLIDRFRPDAYAACWDADWRPAFRVAAVPSYKAHRVVRVRDDAADAEEVPDELSVQVPLIAQALALLGLARVEARGYEADDVVATLAARWSAVRDVKVAGGDQDDRVDDVVVVSGDRDLFQLVDDARRVRVAYIGKGVANLDVVDQAGLLRRYGVRSGRDYLDMAVLRGDPSDGLPGVKGIGEKTAADLVGRFGGLDGLLAAARDPDTTMASGHRSKLVASVDDIAAARIAATAVIDTALTSYPAGELREVTGLRSTPPDVPELAAFADRWGIRSTVNRVLAALDRLRPG